MFDSLKKLLNNKPATAIQHVDALLREGKDHVRDSNWSSAAQCYRAVLATRSDDVDVLVGLGFILSRQQKLAEATVLLHRAIEKDPRNADAHYMLGAIAREQSKRDKAITHFSRAIELQPLLVDAYKDLSIAYFESGESGLAMEAIRRGIEVDPASLELRLVLGNILAHGGDRRGALDAYQAGLSIHATSPELHNSIGSVLRDLGETEQATASYRRALSLRPDYLDAHLNMANLMLREQLFDQALMHFTEAVALAPDTIDGYIGVTGILQIQKNTSRMLPFLDGALARFPGEPRLLYAKGGGLAQLGQFDGAIAAFEAAVKAAPEFASAYVGLGNARLKKGDRAQALRAFECAARFARPTDYVSHMISALSGNSPERASDGYVASLFDSYADNFDSHLVKSLQYNMPDQLARALRAVEHTERGNWTVLDLGCGTGLAGAAIAGDAKHLVGIDLSAKMLERAKALNLYQRLECSDLESMMRTEPSASYDVVIAADVFVYIGKLDNLVEQVHRLLRPTGLFAFSVEALTFRAGGPPEDENLSHYQLNDTGRYTHSRAYLQRLAADRGFSVLDLRSAQGRVNDGKPVDGYIALFRK